MALKQINVLLHNHNAIGDTLAMTCAVRDMAQVRRCTNCGFECNWPAAGDEIILQCPLCEKESLLRKYCVMVVTAHLSIWDNNPYLSDFVNPSVELYIGPGKGSQASNTSGKHICEAYRCSIIEHSGGGINFPQGELFPDLHFSDYELSRAPMIEGRYWVLCNSKHAPFTAKFWPPEYWQEVVNALQHITFVQVGHTSDFNPTLTGSNVINMVGQTQGENGLRDLFHLFAHITKLIK